VKTSRYNILLEEGDCVLAYNCLTGALLKMDKEQYADHLLVPDGNISTSDTLKRRNIITSLKRGGFIVEDDFDEIEFIKAKHFSRRFGSQILSLVVAPTLDCNFACPYCYEPEKKAEYMTEEIETRLVEYIGQRLRSMSALDVTWFGGEPTLAIETMYRLSEQFHKKAAENGARYSETITTNGYNLTKEVAVRLRNIAGDVKAQVTLDGPPEVHNARRPLTDGGGSFHVIVNNLEEIAGIVMPVVVRVNLSRENFHSLPKLLDILVDRRLQKRLSLYVAPTDVRPGVCQSASDYALDVPRFAKMEAEAQMMLLDRGFRMCGIMEPLDIYCPAVYADRLIVAPNGDIHRCMQTIDDPKERMGNIMEPTTIDKNDLKWMAWNPFEREECLNCEVLPLCMGGCTYKYMQMEKRPPVADSDRWVSLKYNIREIIRSRYRQHLLAKSTKE